MTISEIKNKERIDWVAFFVCLMLVIAPILQQHNGFFINGGWSALLLGMPFCFFKYFSTHVVVRKNVFIGLVFIILYYLWAFIDHGFSTMDVVRLLILFIYYLALSTGKFKFKYIIYISAGIALAACIGLVAQYICYYIFHFKLQFLSVNTLLDTSTRWYARISSRSITGAFYRPSAFFLEPSHMFIFCFPPALFLLFNENATKQTRILGFIIVGGIMATTSGMGIAFSLGCIIAYLVMFKKPMFEEGSFANFLAPRTLIILLFGILLIVYLFNHVDIVYRSLIRIFAENEFGYNAINGRTDAGQSLVDHMSGRQYIMGVTDALGEDGAGVSGFYATLYKYGFVGIFLSYAYYVHGFFNVNKNYKYMCLILLIISFLCAHTHNYFYLLYYSSFIFQGLKTKGMESTDVAPILSESSSASVMGGP